MDVTLVTAIYMEGERGNPVIKDERPPVTCYSHVRDNGDGGLFK